MSWAAYVQMYLKEEIREEGLVRRLDPFMRFLGVAGLMNAQVLNIENISREAQAKRTTVDLWFGILKDTLLGSRLPAWRTQAKVRETAHPKFYWLDPGVARAAAGLLESPLDPVAAGFALETQVIYEVKSWLEAQGKHPELFFHRTSNGVEVDLIIRTRN
jgi:predicted AAA+ superfamily ATPase